MDALAGSLSTNRRTYPNGNILGADSGHHGRSRWDVVDQIPGIDEYALASSSFFRRLCRSNDLDTSDFHSPRIGSQDFP